MAPDAAGENNQFRSGRGTAGDAASPDSIPPLPVDSSNSHPYKHDSLLTHAHLSFSQGPLDTPFPVDASGPLNTHLPWDSNLPLDTHLPPYAPPDRLTELFTEDDGKDVKRPPRRRKSRARKPGTRREDSAYHEESARHSEGVPDHASSRHDPGSSLNREEAARMIEEAQRKIEEAQRSISEANRQIEQAHLHEDDDLKMVEARDRYSDAPPLRFDPGLIPIVGPVVSGLLSGASSGFSRATPSFLRGTLPNPTPEDDAKVEAKKHSAPASHDWIREVVSGSVHVRPDGSLKTVGKPRSLPKIVPAPADTSPVDHVTDPPADSAVDSAADSAADSPTNNETTPVFGMVSPAKDEEITGAHTSMRRDKAEIPRMPDAHRSGVDDSRRSDHKDEAEANDRPKEKRSKSLPSDDEAETPLQYDHPAEYLNNGVVYTYPYPLYMSPKPWGSWPWLGGTWPGWGSPWNLNPWSPMYLMQNPYVHNAPLPFQYLFLDEGDESGDRRARIEGMDGDFDLSPETMAWLMQNASFYAPYNSSAGHPASDHLASSHGDSTSGSSFTQRAADFKPSEHRANAHTSEIGGKGIPRGSTPAEKTFNSQWEADIHGSIFPMEDIPMYTPIRRSYMPADLASPKILPSALMPTDVFPAGIATQEEMMESPDMPLRNAAYPIAADEPYMSRQSPFAGGSRGREYQIPVRVGDAEILGRWPLYPNSAPFIMRDNPSMAASLSYLPTLRPAKTGEETFENWLSRVKLPIHVRASTSGMELFRAVETKSLEYLLSVVRVPLALAASVVQPIDTSKAFATAPEADPSLAANVDLDAAFTAARFVVEVRNLLVEMKYDKQSSKAITSCDEGDETGETKQACSMASSEGVPKVLPVSDESDLAAELDTAEDEEDEAEASSAENYEEGLEGNTRFGEVSGKLPDGEKQDDVSPSEQAVLLPLDNILDWMRGKDWFPGEAVNEADFDYWQRGIDEEEENDALMGPVQRLSNDDDIVLPAPGLDSDREPISSSDMLPWIPVDSIAGTLPAWLFEAFMGPYALMFQDLVRFAQDGFIRMQLIFDSLVDEPIPVTANQIEKFTEQTAQAFRASLDGDEADALKSIAVTVKQLPTFLPENFWLQPVENPEAKTVEDSGPRIVESPALTVYDELVRVLVNPLKDKSFLAEQQAILIHEKNHQLVGEQTAPKDMNSGLPNTPRVSESGPAGALEETKTTKSSAAAAVEVQVTGEHQNGTKEFQIGGVQNSNLPWLPLDGIIGGLPGFFLDKLGKPGAALNRLGGAWGGASEKVDKAASKFLDPLIGSQEPPVPDYSGRNDPTVPPPKSMFDRLRQSFGSLVGKDESGQEPSSPLDSLGLAGHHRSSEPDTRARFTAPTAREDQATTPTGNPLHAPNVAKPWENGDAYAQPDPSNSYSPHAHNNGNAYRRDGNVGYPSATDTYGRSDGDSAYDRRPSDNGQSSGGYPSPHNSKTLGPQIVGERMRNDYSDSGRSSSQYGGYPSQSEVGGRYGGDGDRSSYDNRSSRSRYDTSSSEGRYGSDRYDNKNAFSERGRRTGAGQLGSGQLGLGHLGSGQLGSGQFGTGRLGANNGEQSRWNNLGSFAGRGRRSLRGVSPGRDELENELPSTRSSEQYDNQYPPGVSFLPYDWEVDIEDGLLDFPLEPYTMPRLDLDISGLGWPSYDDVLHGLRQPYWLNEEIQDFALSPQGAAVQSNNSPYGLLLPPSIEQLIDRYRLVEIPPLLNGLLPPNQHPPVVKTSVKTQKGQGVMNETETEKNRTVYEMIQDVKARTAAQQNLAWYDFLPYTPEELVAYHQLAKEKTQRNILPYVDLMHPLPYLQIPNHHSRTLRQPDSLLRRKLAEEAEVSSEAAHAQSADVTTVLEDSAANHGAAEIGNDAAADAQAVDIAKENSAESESDDASHSQPRSDRAAFIPTQVAGVTDEWDDYDAVLDEYGDYADYPGEGAEQPEKADYVTAKKGATNPRRPSAQLRRDPWFVRPPEVVDGDKPLTISELMLGMLEAMNRAAYITSVSLPVPSISPSSTYAYVQAAGLPDMRMRMSDVYAMMQRNEQTLPPAMAQLVNRDLYSYMRWGLSRNLVKRDTTVGKQDDKTADSEKEARASTVPSADASNPLEEDMLPESPTDDDFVAGGEAGEDDSELTLSKDIQTLAGGPKATRSLSDVVDIHLRIENEDEEERTERQGTERLQGIFDALVGVIKGGISNIESNIDDVKSGRFNMSDEDSLKAMFKKQSERTAATLIRGVSSEILDTGPPLKVEEAAGTAGGEAGKHGPAKHGGPSKSSSSKKKGKSKSSPSRYKPSAAETSPDEGRAAYLKRGANSGLLDGLSAPLDRGSIGKRSDFTPSLRRDTGGDPYGARRPSYSGPGEYDRVPSLRAPPDYGRPRVEYSRPNTDYGRPGVDYSRPSMEYSSNRPGLQYGDSRPGLDYGRPAADYNRPGMSRNPPIVDYDRPSTNYGRPAMEYDRPGMQYSRPGMQYSQPRYDYGASNGGLSPARGYGPYGGGYTPPGRYSRHGHRAKAVVPQGSAIQGGDALQAADDGSERPTHRSWDNESS